MGRPGPGAARPAGGCVAAVPLAGPCPGAEAPHCPSPPPIAPRPVPGLAALPDGARGRDPARGLAGPPGHPGLALALHRCSAAGVAFGSIACIFILFCPCLLLFFLFPPPGTTRAKGLVAGVARWPRAGDRGTVARPVACWHQGTRGCGAMMRGGLVGEPSCRSAWGSAPPRGDVAGASAVAAELEGAGARRLSSGRCGAGSGAGTLLRWSPTGWERRCPPLARMPATIRQARLLQRPLSAAFWLTQAFAFLISRASSPVASP